MTDSPLRVMTFNLRFPSESDDGNLWPERRDIAADLIRTVDADVIALQEAYRVQLDWLARELPTYGFIGRERYGGTDEEHCAILFRRDRFMVESCGTFWLSETPDVPGSRTWWPDDHPRIATWAGLIEPATGARRLALSTHFPLGHDHPERRTRAAWVIREWIEAQRLPADMPVVLMGDFNAVPDSELHRSITEKCRDACDEAQERIGPTSTVHRFTGRPQREGARIDWILLRGVIRAVRSEVVTFNRGGKYPSDHFPVAVDLVRE